MNPFQAPAMRLRAEVNHPEAVDPAGAEAAAGIFEAAAELWDRIAALPAPTVPEIDAAATALRRLEETMYWAARAAGKTWD